MGFKNLRKSAFLNLSNIEAKITFLLVVFEIFIVVVAIRNYFIKIALDLEIQNII